ncbi:hypothetical protein NDU88_001932 [Pleurodeles waltl]|uniref:Uncharacterized protein n=1 Tax=Pleurodeles waltl TaxID=8319 RepID=A0AAV7PCL4_PLEWA|nr:hypothetical protein NDU88_001932 [Pleurodeles waltl]
MCADPNLHTHATSPPPLRSKDPTPHTDTFAPQHGNRYRIGSSDASIPYSVPPLLSSFPQGAVPGGPCDLVTSALSVGLLGMTLS